MRQYYKSDIIKLAKPIEDLNSFVVYFLLKEDEIVYVGQSRYLSIRLHAHAKDKDFNRIFTILCIDEKDALQLEQHYIKTLNPIYNRLHNPLYVKKPMVRVSPLKRKAGVFLKKEDIEVMEKGKDSLKIESKINSFLIESPLGVKIPLNTYEKKYIGGKFLWVFNIEGVLYEAEYSKGGVYYFDNKSYKPINIKGSIGSIIKQRFATNKIST